MTESIYDKSHDLNFEELAGMFRAYLESPNQQAEISEGMFLNGWLKRLMGEGGMRYDIAGPLIDTAWLEAHSLRPET